MKKIIISLFIILVVFSIVLYKQDGKTNNVAVSIEKSNKFSEEEINEAIGSVKNKFKEFEGCQLTDLWYSEKIQMNLLKAI